MRERPDAGARLAPTEVGEIYAEGRRRLIELVGGLDSEEAARQVPTCPDWSVADVLAHLSGVCADILAGNLTGVASEGWTAAQVAARRGRSIAELVTEWSDLGPQVEAISAGFPEAPAAQWITDQITHEHDIRAALGRAGSRDCRAVDVGVRFLVTLGFDGEVARRGLPPIEVRTPGYRWIAGTGTSHSEANADVAVAGTVEASAFELLRAFTGRRALSQVRALRWTTDPGPYLPAFEFGPFRPSSVPIAE